MSIAARLLLAAVAAYALVCLAMFVFQRRLQYHPDPGPMDPAAAGFPQATQETLATPDGERIVVWWAAPRAAGRPVYLYLHGNGAHLHARALRLAKLAEDGAGVMAVSWRGYGGSTGTPTEAGLMTDARTAHDELRRRAPDAPMVIYGESLGTTIATMLAAETQPAGLLLDSSFASALSVARDAYPWLPVALLLRDTYRADLAAPKVRAPVLQVHCRLDPVTPFAQAQALNALFPMRQELVVLESACHVPSLADYLGPWRRFVDTALSRTP
jgi:pimeloyl-ACP methyl ester carboxylesterase